MAQQQSIHPPDAGRFVAQSGLSAAWGWLLSAEALVEILLIIVMVVLTWVSVAVNLEQQRTQLLNGAARDSANLARTAAQSVGQTVASIDDSLRLLRSVHDRDPAGFDVAAWASRVNENRPAALELAVIDRNGILAASSLGPLPTPLDLSKEDFFRAHLSGKSDKLFISRPTPGSKSSRWSVLFTRKLTTPDGWFDGCIAAAIDASWLTRLHQALDIGHGTLMLVGTDGTIRAYSAGPNFRFGDAVGHGIEDSALMAASAKADHGTLTWSDPVDHSSEIVGFERVDGYPLVVATSLNTHEVLAPYRLFARQAETFGGCLTLLILAAGLFLLGNTRRLLVSRQVLQDAVDAISQGIIMIDHTGHVPVINRRVRELLHLPAGATNGKLTLGRLLGGPALLGSSDEFVAMGESMWRPAEDDSSAIYEHTRADGTILEIRTHRLETGGFVRTYADITARRKTELEIIYLAHHDSLTGLANRRFFSDRLAKAISRSRQDGQDCAVLCVDLDGFKYINDLYGHTFGDHVLLEATDRLRNAVGKSGVVARFGGDEFFILMEQINQFSAPEALARQLVALLSYPYKIDGREVLMSASVGLARCPADGDTADDLLTNADTALYRAKEGGRSTFRSYEPAMAIRSLERRQMEHDLRIAVAMEQLQVVYQPIFDSQARTICRFEALLRWDHPTRGEISPEIFIPVAEETGLIVALGQWVMQTACAEAARWPAAVGVAVNLSPKQFLEPDLVRSIAAVLAQTGLAPHRLSVEVTEGVLIENVDRASLALSTLKGLGVGIALDDFGTGYSSLSYLNRFPFDAIKIDKSFVKSLCETGESDAIIRAILTLGHSLGLRVVAEGVETEAQLSWLRTAGCVEVQGFLLGRALTPERVLQCLKGAAAAAGSIR